MRARDNANGEDAISGRQDEISERVWQELEAHVSATGHEWAVDPDLGPYCDTCAEKEA